MKNIINIAFILVSILSYAQSGKLQKANELFEKICNNGNANGCNSLATSYYKGNGVKQNIQKSKELLKKACDLGKEKSCNNYAFLNKQ